MGKRANGEGAIRQRADGRFEARGYVRTAAGERRRLSFFGQTRKEAHDKLLAALERDRQGVPAMDGRWTVATYLDYWMNEVVATKNRPRTAELYATTIRLHIAPLLGRRPLKDLTPTDVQTALNRLLADGASPRTIHKMRQVLSSALGRAEKEELVLRNVARLVDLPRYERKLIKPWTADQARHFLEVAQGHRWEVGFWLLVLYGMRRGEVLGLRWGDIDFSRNTISVRKQLQRIDGKLVTGPVKTSAGQRELPLLPTVRELLLRQATVDGGRPGLDPDSPQSLNPERTVVATRIGTPVEPRNFAQQFYDLGAAAGLPRITVHHTRHTAATLLKSLGVPARDAQAILGHSNVTTTQQLYQHADIDDARRALTAVETALSPAAPHAAQPHDLSAMGVSGGQMWGSGTHELLADTSIDTNENRRLTGVETADFVGGSGGDRTRDILLKSPIGASIALLPTPVVCALHTRARRLILGRVGVGMGVNVRRSLDDALALRAACNQALSHKLRALSFPLNLVPATPLIDKKEAV